MGFGSGKWVGGGLKEENDVLERKRWVV